MTELLLATVPGEANGRAAKIFLGAAPKETTPEPKPGPVRGSEYIEKAIEQLSGSDSSLGDRNPFLPISFT